MQAGREFIHRFYDEWQRTECALPPWQREFVWSDEQKLSFYNRIFQDAGFFGSTVVWRRRRSPERDFLSTQYLILDGQQRLTSMGVPLVRYDGQKQETRLPTWDSSQMAWGWRPVQPEEGVFTLPQIVEPYKLATQLMAKFGEGAEPLVAHLYTMTDRSHDVDLVIIRIDTTGLPFGDQTKTAVQIFRDMNRGGTPISAETLDALTDAARIHGDEW